VLVIPSDFVSNIESVKIARTFLETEFSGEERHVRRLEKIENIERLSHES
jgi:ribose 5-phosphate isomerase RpiB